MGKSAFTPHISSRNDRSHLASGVAIADRMMEKLCPKLDFALAKMLKQCCYLISCTILNKPAISRSPTPIERRDAALSGSDCSLVVNPRFPVMHCCHPIIFQQITVFNLCVNYPMIAAFHPTYYFTFQVSKSTSQNRTAVASFHCC
jgi:hypothetical protein